VLISTSILTLPTALALGETIQVQGDMNAMSDQLPVDIGTAAALLVIAVVLVVLATVGSVVAITS
jgi:hypothetical protein